MLLYDYCMEKQSHSFALYSVHFFIYVQFRSLPNFLQVLMYINKGTVNRTSTDFQQGCNMFSHVLQWNTLLKIPLHLFSEVQL